ncbi:MAG: EamA family transporter [Gilliamella sp.]|uniref:EamA family transporter n=1 Tax=Gilliamella TaxID=1193503 RepID=UPI0004616048|nr:MULTISPECIES: EamA family transporter [Gilliamella]KDN09726.1 Permeases of the drug/metabolite transporter (DMT) superfamily [Gilliamella apicola]MCO6537047.1 EamA family transporter [Gilliamella sp.]MCO6540026.1 EamA family transporter [Gilliamella sp.]MCO6545236.1 EamA family transporter [Gilliamella sp.]MCO6547232.1 EamA family transporter [Gilliamella sp.]
MSPLVIILWISNICFDTLGQVAFKFAAIAPNNRDGWYYWLDLSKNKWIWVGVISYIAEFLLWLAFLTLVPLSQGVLLASFNIITIMLVGRIIFKELLTIYRLIGMLLITAGVIFVGMS